MTLTGLKRIYDVVAALQIEDSICPKEENVIPVHHQEHSEQ